jgi:hypothetical protein
MPFYALNSTGSQSFLYSDLGVSKFNYHLKKKNDQGEEFTQVNFMEGSKTLREYID